MTFDIDYALQVLPIILRAALTTLIATGLGMALALLLGMGFALAVWSRWPALRRCSAVAATFLRGTPLLVQLYFIYYVLPLYGVATSALATGIAALGLQYAAYVAEVYRSGIESISAGQWDAAGALGLSRGRTWITVILPQAVPRVIPPLGNYLIAMFKSTPYLAAITVNEMLGAALDEAGQSFRYLEPMLIVGGIFMVCSYGSAFLVRHLERAYPVERARG